MIDSALQAFQIWLPPVGTLSGVRLHVRSRFFAGTVSCRTCSVVPVLAWLWSCAGGSPAQSRVLAAAADDPVNHTPCLRPKPQVWCEASLAVAECSQSPVRPRRACSRGPDPVSPRRPRQARSRHSQYVSWSRTRLGNGQERDQIRRPFFQRPGSGTRGPDVRSIDTPQLKVDQPIVNRLQLQLFQDSLDRPIGRPAAKPCVNSLPRPITLRQITPRILSWLKWHRS